MEIIIKELCNKIPSTDDEKDERRIDWFGFQRL